MQEWIRNQMPGRISSSAVSPLTNSEEKHTDPMERGANGEADERTRKQGGLELTKGGGCF